MRIAINGFGRIGRLVARAAMDAKIKIVGINDLTDTKTLAHLLKYDSVHGPSKRKIEYGKDYIKVNGKKIPVFAIKNPEELPWKKLKVDIVVESTGRFRTEEEAKMHLVAGAKKVLLSAPPKDDKIKTIVIGVNHKDIKKTDLIISNASCTTNSAAPAIKVLHEAFGIKNGFLTTVHSFTADQKLVDAPHKDLRRARSAVTNIIPTSTGAAKSIGEVYPPMKGKLNGRAIRVPCPDGSITDLALQLKKKVTVEQVNNALKKASKKMKGIIEYSEEDLVSSDIINNPSSGIFDSKLTQVNGDLINVFIWYDNEMGYAQRMVDMLKLMK